MTSLECRFPARARKSPVDERNARLSRESLLALESYRPPSDPGEATLARIWAAALGIDRSGVDDDFFELGGDSLAAAAIASGVHGEFGVEMPTHLLLDSPTVARLWPVLRALQASGAAESPDTDSMLLTLRAAGHADPVVLIPPRKDSSLRFRALLEHLDPARPVFGLIHRPVGDLGSMVREQLRQIAAVTGARPVHLVGICWGSLVALEMACTAHELGLRPASVVLLDPPPLLSTADRRRSWLRQRVLPWFRLLPRRAAIYRAAWSRLSFGQRVEFVISKARAAGRRLNPLASRDDLLQELVGKPDFRALTELSLQHQPKRPAAPVDLVLTNERPDSATRRARRHWIEFLGTQTRIHEVPGRDTGDVLGEHLHEFGQVLERITRRPAV
jgi:thioesterase domain-containing protein/acyl carrier protein